jgi:hypothetical protein
VSQSQDKIQKRVIVLRDRAARERVPFPGELDKALLACKTVGEVKRLWKKHRQAAETKTE